MASAVAMENIEDISQESPQPMEKKTVGREP
jgi:hypothetical protein